ncbi:hypothetical protein M758_4G248100 [Ceratodon purpureus]|nr:hypothetical protein M758_4G248100 [Ceratodon purpureus]
MAPNSRPRNSTPSPHHATRPKHKLLKSPREIQPCSQFTKLSNLLHHHHHHHHITTTSQAHHHHHQHITTITTKQIFTITSTRRKLSTLIHAICRPIYGTYTDGAIAAMMMLTVACLLFCYSLAPKPVTVP